MLRFYGIYDYEDMESRKFLRLARRLFAYEGVMTARYMNEQDEPHTGGAKEVQSDHDRKKMYKEANVTTEQVTVSGPDYLADKLKGPIR